RRRPGDLHPSARGHGASSARAAARDVPRAGGLPGGRRVPSGSLRTGLRPEAAPVPSAVAHGSARGGGGAPRRAARPLRPAAGGGGAAARRRRVAPPGRPAGRGAHPGARRGGPRQLPAGGGAPTRRAPDGVPRPAARGRGPAGRAALDRAPPHRRPAAGRDADPCAPGAGHGACPGGVTGAGGRVAVGSRRRSGTAVAAPGSQVDWIPITVSGLHPEQPPTSAALHRGEAMSRFVAPIVLIATLVVAGCDGLGQAMTAHTDVVARAAGHELTVDEAASLL